MNLNHLRHLIFPTIRHTPSKFSSVKPAKSSPGHELRLEQRSVKMIRRRARNRLWLKYGAPKPA